MPFQFKTKEVKSESIIVKVEIELNKCTLTPQELADKLEFLINSSRDRGFSEFIVSLLRNAGASTWELHNLEVI